MLRTFTLLISLCLLFPVHADQSSLTAVSPDASVVDLAGQQRMLSQRIVKAYAQVGLDVLPTLARAQRDDAIERFEENLKALGSRIGTAPEVVLAHQDLVNGWKTFRRAASGPVSRDTALVLSRHSRVILDDADRLTFLVEQVSADPGSQAVNDAGRLRMLSQRLVKAYLLLSWGVEDQGVRDELEGTVQQFQEQLATLMAHPENTPAIRAELEEIELQWTWLQTAVTAAGPMTYRLVVVEAGESILSSVNHVTRLYAQASRR